MRFVLNRNNPQSTEVSWINVFCFVFNVTLNQNYIVQKLKYKYVFHISCFSYKLSKYLVVVLV